MIIDYRFSIDSPFLVGSPRLLHDLHPGEAAVGAQHREQGIGRQHGRFVRVGVHDLDLKGLN